MRYAVAIVDTESDEAKFAAGLSGGHLKPRRVYVVGMDEAAEFAFALQGVSDTITISEENAHTMLQFIFSEAIGTEVRHGISLDELLAQARRRAATLQACADEPRARRRR